MVKALILFHMIPWGLDKEMITHFYMTLIFGNDLDIYLLCHVILGSTNDDNGYAFSKSHSMMYPL